MPVKRQLNCTLEKDESYIKKLFSFDCEFLKSIKKQTNITDTVYHERDDDKWLDAASEWKSIIEAIKYLETQEKQVREKLISMCGDKNISGGGIKVSRNVRKGNIDYSSIKELSSIDLEQYRKDPIEYWKIS